MKVEVPDELLKQIGVTGDCTLSFGTTEIGWEQQKRKYAQGIYFFKKDWDKEEKKGEEE